MATSKATRKGIAGIGSVLRQETPPVPVSFNIVGDSVRGIVSAGRIMPLTDPNTGRTKISLDGKPIQQVVLTLNTEDGRKVLYIRSGVQEAVNKALSEAGVEDIAIGDEVYVAYVGEGEPIKEDWDAPKLYEAEITPVEPPLA